MLMVACVHFSLFPVQFTIKNFSQWASTDRLCEDAARALGSGWARNEHLVFDINLQCPDTWSPYYDKLVAQVSCEDVAVERKSKPDNP